MVKKISQYILSSLLIFCIICNNSLIVEASTIKLNKTSLIMQYKEGYYLKLNTIYKPTWLSKNTNIATVSRDGFVRAKGLGTTVIVAKLKGKTYKCKIKVKSKKIKKYNLSKKQLSQLASVCYHEQGSNKGAAAEASLMANLFESPRGKKFGTGATGLYNYVKKSGWFANASKSMKKNDAPKSVIADVKQVLVNGKRILPEYVDEHDYIYDIVKVTNNGKEFKRKKRKLYKHDITQIRNKFGTNYYFYSFPDKYSDAFGYTSKYNKHTMGEYHYSYNSL